MWANCFGGKQANKHAVAPCGGDSSGAAAAQGQSQSVASQILWGLLCFVEEAFIGETLRSLAILKFGINYRSNLSHSTVSFISIVEIFKG